MGTFVFVKKTLLGVTLMASTSLAESRSSIFLPYVFSASPDPFNILWSGDWVAASHAWQTLVDLSETGKIIPRIAKNWQTSVDGLKWTFEITSDLKWSNGQPITVDQIVKSLNISRAGTSHTDLSDAITSISSENNKIIILLKHKVGGLLAALTYIDWAIVHPETVKVENGKNRVVSSEPCSGPFCFNRVKSSQNTIQLNANAYSQQKSTLSLTSGSLEFFDDCKALVENSGKILSFRSYAETFRNDCKVILEKAGFNVFRTQPTWILKADFTKHGQISINKSDRLFLIRAIQEMVVRENPQFGVGRATGLRASHLFGSLSELEFDKILSFFPSKASVKNISIHIATMQSWGEWASFKWFCNALAKISGVEIKKTILSKKDFSSQMASGKLQIEYDLIFVPFGVGDPDPNGAWRIAARHIYPDAIDRNTVRSVFYESDKSAQERSYKLLATSLIESGVVIPLKMDADYVGYHNSVKIGDIPPFRVGLTLYDLLPANK